MFFFLIEPQNKDDYWPSGDIIMWKNFSRILNSNKLHLSPLLLNVGR